MKKILNFALKIKGPPTLPPPKNLERAHVIRRFETCDP